MTFEPDVAGPQSEQAVVSQRAPASAPSVLDQAQRELLRSTLNCIVPARGGLPGAGDLDVGGSIERTLGGATHLRRLFLDGLREIDITAQRRTGSSLVDLDHSSQIGVLRTVEHDWPVFFVGLVEHAYRGYYTLAVVQRAIGFEPRPPQPLGHRLPPFDPANLEQQRRRIPFWRRTT